MNRAHPPNVQRGIPRQLGEITPVLKNRIACGLLIAALTLTGCASFTTLATPTQYPGIVNTVVALTAAAASTQTATGIPSATVVHSGTSAPPNSPTATETPSPTSTFIFVFHINTSTPTPTNTPEPVSGPFYRVRSDDTNGRFEGGSRAESTGLAWPPQVNPAFAAPNETSGTHRTNLDNYGWDSYQRWLLNDNSTLFRYATDDGLAMFNSSGWPQMESLLFGNNVVIAETAGQKYGWARIVTMDYEAGPPHPYVDYQSAPWFVQKFTTVNKHGAVGLSARGEVFYPLVSSQELYFPLDWLEPFPSLPRTVQVKIADLHIHLEPTFDSATLGQLHADQSFEILQYAPRGSEVWGLVKNNSLKGWVVLFNPYTSPYYTTTWYMQTDPPP
jgi:hypothetical protein